jgi:hypothetical protein
MRSASKFLFLIIPFLFPVNNSKAIIQVSGEQVTHQNLTNKQSLNQLKKTIQEEWPGSYLPLVVIDTHGETIIDNAKIMVDLAIIYNGMGELNFPDDEPNDYNGKAGIEYRGYTSYLSSPKKSYGFETWTIEGTDTSCSLLEMPAETDWVLYGPYLDKALIRNNLSYYLGQAAGHYEPRTKFCELFINDMYQGLYVLTEKIKRDDGRVNIAKLEENETSGINLTGGYIIKIDRSNDGSYTDGWFSPYTGTSPDNLNVFFAFHYPRYDRIVEEQKNYIENVITNFENVLFSDDYLDAATGYKTLIDLQSFIDYFIAVELAKNIDGYRLSTFLYKDRDDRDPRIHMGPLWDFDFSFGSCIYYEGYDPTGWYYSMSTDEWGTPFWWSKMMTDPVFVNQLNCRWKALRHWGLSNEVLMDRIDEYVNEIGLAVNRNYNEWPVLGEYIYPNYFNGNTYQEEIAYLKNWILDRTAWLDENMPGVDCSTDNNEIKVTLMKLMAKPNPGIGFTRIEVHNPLKKDLKLEITNLSGVVVFTSVIENNLLYFKEISLEPGMYVARISGDHEMQTIKIIIQ